ncbi:MAG: S41 family peptidase [Flavobacteriaceae bacterium]
MKKLLFLFVLFLFVGCKDDLDDTIQVPTTRNLEIEDFVYKAMNTVYYWQKEVPNLADDRFSNDKEYTSFLQSFKGPEELFDGLQYKDDRFSLITDDYVDLEKQLNSISLSNGMKFGLGRISSTDSDLYGYVRYVLPNTDATQKGLKRGDIFTHVDGSQLTVENYESLLFSNKASYTLSMATISNLNIQSTGTTISLNNTELTEKELHISKVIEHEGKKVGYVMYNGFASNQEDDLKNAFTDLASQQIDELVFDLRYNPGGSVNTSQLLAGLIAGERAGKVFGKMVYNEKLAKYNREIEIIDSSIKLGLSRVIFLVTSGSASASEMMINGLNPYMDVVLIGNKTYGKNVGSFIVYDYIDNNQTKNPNHTWALLPITFGIFNSVGFGDYGNGFSPNIELNEDLENLGVLGETNEPLLKKALDFISGKVTASRSFKTNSVKLPFNEIQIEEGRAIYNPTD